MIKIFDSLTHPTLDGTWLNNRFNCYTPLEYLLEQMDKYNIYRAFAVGMKNVGAYNEIKFIDFLKPHDNLIPVAFCEEVGQLETIAKLGYTAIKIHPRISNFKEDDDVVFNIIKEANTLKLIVLYCGYLGCTPAFLKKIGEEKLIYLHCGGEKFLHTLELLIDKENILLDLSYTLSKYVELSNSIQNALYKYPHRFCIGSDHPEVTYSTLRATFHKVTAGLAMLHKELIAYKNLENFVKQNLR